MFRFKYLVLIVAFIFIGVGNVAASDWEVNESQIIQDTYKKWTITFNKEVNANTINNANIYIESENSRLFNHVEVGSKPNQVIVEAPNGGYESGKTYTLYITTKVKSKENVVLHKPLKMDFTLINDENVSYMRDKEKVYTYLLQQEFLEEYEFDENRSQEYAKNYYPHTGLTCYSNYDCYKEDKNALYRYAWYYGEIKALEYPIEVGKTWESFDGYTGTIIDIKTVEVGAGTFENVVVVKEVPFYDENAFTLNYYAPNVGLILQEQSYEGTGYITEKQRELVNLR